MSAPIGAMLREAVRGPEPSVSPRELVDAMGGTSAVARQIAGVGPNVRPRDMSVDVRRRYNSAMRRVQRWVTTGGEQRAGGFERLDPNVRRRLVRAAWRQQERRRWAQLQRDGARTRMIGAEVSDETPQPGKRPRTRRRTLPAEGTPGKYLDPETIAQLREAIDDGELDEAGAIYTAAFFTEGDDYVWDFEPEVFALEALNIWPAGAQEGSW